MTLSAVEVDHLKQAPAVDGVLPAVLKRWSPYTFSSREVSAADLRRVFEAARWAASASNEQPWRFLVGRRDSPHSSVTYNKIFSTLIDFNKGWAGTAPVLMLGATRTKFAHNGTDNPYALYDLGAAGALLNVQAAALGLRAHSMAGFDHDAARAAFEIPSDYLLGAAIALGYQGEPAAMDDETLLAREIKPRTRKPLSEIVLSAWDVAAELGGELG